ncbi:MAG: BtrH N-terminal domain-containing protein [Promethearchaeota archaeon]
MVSKRSAKKSPKKRTKKLLKKSVKTKKTQTYEVENEILMIKDFNHISGNNCQLSSLRKVLAYHNLELSENMLLGIASGIGFIYWAMKLMPTPFVGGLNGKDITLFENILLRLGGTAKLLKTGSLKVSYKQFKDYLRQGEPLLSFVDMAYLTYFYGDNSSYPMDKNHFGGHTMVVYGLDEPKNIVYVSDHFQRSTTLTIQQYMDAHSSKHVPFAAKNRKLQFTFPNELPDLEPIIIEAIKENSSVMINPPIRNLGLKGMLKFKDMVATWPKIYKGENLLLSLIMTFIYNQTGGTGGAMFRNMYTEFLSEAYELTENDILKEATNIYRQAAAAWDNVSVCLLPNELPSLKEIRLAFLESSKVQMEALPDYRKKLQEIDDRLKSHMTTALKEIQEFQKYIPALQGAIQEAHDLEAKAWAVLSKI